jgi:DNA-binding PadR family transcriptional regulator
MVKRSAVNATQASLLALLDGTGGELTGGELVRVAEARIGQFWSLTRSQVYRELVVLEQDGLVQPGSPGPREARPVRITDDGRASYRQWLTGDLPDDTIRIPVLLAVSFGGALEPDALRRLLARTRAEHRARLAAYEQLDVDLAGLPDGDPWGRATVAFGLLYERAALAWFDTLPASVRPARTTSRRWTTSRSAAPGWCGGSSLPATPPWPRPARWWCCTPPTPPRSTSRSWPAAPA